MNSSIEKKPLVSHIYTADPSARVFNGVLYIYPSHDKDLDVESNDNGDQYQMEDYHVFKMESLDKLPTDSGMVLHEKEVPWVSTQMWAPDCVEKNGKYYLFFPARDKDHNFRLGVAISDTPDGKFVPQPEPIKGSYSIDPCVLQDDDGADYVAFGGLWGGQLEKYRNHVFSAENGEPADNEPAVCPKIARLTPDMLEFAEKPRDIVIVDKDGTPIKAGDHERRYFEDPWMFKKDGKYYFTYSTGDTHLLNWSVSDNVYGPYTYGGVILTPVLGWTTHHSIVQFNGTWYLFYHDCELSGGINQKRNIKFMTLPFDENGNIITQNP